MKIISINDAHKELEQAVKDAGGLSKYLQKNNLSKDQRSGLKKCLDGRIKPAPRYLKPLGIVKAFVKL